MTALTLVDRVTIRQALERYANRFLTSSQYRILCMVYDRTLAWDKASAKISVREFAEGRGGYHHGTGLSPRTIHRAIDALVGLGVLVKEGVAGAVSTFRINLERLADLLPSSKHDRGGGTSAKKTQARRETSAILSDHIKGTTGLREPDDPPPTALVSPQPENTGKVSGGIAAALAKAEANAQKAEARRTARTNPHRVQDAEQRFREVMAKEWPDAVTLPWHGRQRGQWKTYRTQGLFTNVDPLAVLEWVVRDWSLLLTSTLSWMTDKPVHPDPSTIMNLFPKLVQAYHRRDTLRREAEYKGRAARVRDMRREGWSKEEAEQRVDRVEAVEEKAERETHALRVQLEMKEEAMRRQRAHLQARAGTPVHSAPRRSTDAMRDFDSDMED